MAHMASASITAPTVGFDLDMTLIDSRPGIQRLLGGAVAADRDVTSTPTWWSPGSGRRWRRRLAYWFPADRIPAMSGLYRELYPSYAITGTLAMPGAREAIGAVQAAGGRAIVVTAKCEPNAKLHMEHLGLEPDAVIGDLWAEQKGEALREHGASVYVGDHVGDVRGARTAGALSVAVPTGPCDRRGAERGRSRCRPRRSHRVPGGWFSDYRAGCLPARA